jgi:hypothetical protein
MKNSMDGHCITVDMHTAVGRKDIIEVGIWIPRLANVLVIAVDIRVAQQRDAEQLKICPRPNGIPYSRQFFQWCGTSNGRVKTGLHVLRHV